MKRLLRLMTRMYPRPWRDRYAAEFDALLDDISPHASDVLDVLRGVVGVHMRSVSHAAAWKIISAFTVLGLVTGVAVSFALPVRYTSSAVLRVDGGPHDVNNIAVAALTRRNLGPLINSRNLYADRTEPLEDKVERLKHEIRVGFAGNKLYGIILSFEDSNPVLAQQVTSDLVRLFQQAAPNTALSVLDPPSLPLRPTMPNVPSILIVCTLTGIFVGALVAAFTARMYNPPQLPA